MLYSTLSKQELNFRRISVPAASDLRNFEQSFFGLAGCRLLAIPSSDLHAFCSEIPETALRVGRAGRCGLILAERPLP